MNKYTKYLGEIVASMRDGSFALPQRHCASCARRTRFLISGLESRSIRCLSCKSTAISLATVAQIQQLPLDPAASAVYELSYHGAVFRYLKSNFANFQFSEYFGPPAGGVYVDGVRNEDVQKLSFAPASFELVSSTEVFEHVPDYMAGFAEVCRVLQPGGWFVFTVPFFDDARTEAICRLSAQGGLEWLREEEYHDSQVTGVGTVPVFWHHSKQQILSDLRQVGFKQAELLQTNAFSDRVAQQVVVARR
ncbi:class I SAM-dependent methyltransferase [Piscinibacter sp.]|uniref:class I SAM-dependent methyltransferase n=1 Tax=Piscinibacter sp. TaxID=1903157 RepID=UPI001DEA06F2|nr:class I SAM-dependent methyltransferase [Piscinibacter sp.]MBK7529589.1 class I SAM-dependent methyltransferase [Piscinibacter sp.]